MLLVTIMTIILVTLIINIGSQGIRSSAIFGFESTTKVYSRMINVWLAQNIYLSESIAGSFPELRNYIVSRTPENKATADATLENVVRNNPSIDGMVLLDGQGNVIADSLGGQIMNVARNFSGTELWQKIMTGESSIHYTVDQFPADSTKWVVKIFSPLEDERGNEEAQSEAIPRLPLGFLLRKHLLAFLPRRHDGKHHLFRLPPRRQVQLTPFRACPPRNWPFPLVTPFRG